MTKPMIRLVRPTKSQISLPIQAVFPDRMCLLQPTGYPKSDKQEPLPHWVDVQADLSFAGHIGLIVGFVGALAHSYGYIPLLSGVISL